jgi:hypothetical protein
MQELLKRIDAGSTQQSFGFQLAMGPQPNAFVEKLKPEHMASVIKQIGEDSGREHTRHIVYFAGGVLGFLVLCGLFLGFGKESLLMPILTAFVGFAGGFGIGRSSKK